jgi:PAT family beta-lactamase induction signal transducer AmpG
MTPELPERERPWRWIPSLYLAEGIPYVLVMTVSVVLYKRMGISNADIALYTSWLYLPWVIKPLWSPFIDLKGKKRTWILITQLLIGAGLAGVGLTIPVPGFFAATLTIFWLLAFASATHDIAADGFYMLGLSEHDQAFFVGIRSTFYRLAMIVGQGLLVMLAGWMEDSTGLDPVTLDVRATRDVTALPDPSGRTLDDAEATADLSIVVDETSTSIGTTNQPMEDVDRVVGAVRTWNRQNGFVPAVEDPKGAVAASDPSWWKRHVSKPLGDWLRDTFGPEESSTPAGKEAGSIAIQRIRISRPPPPGEEVIVNVAHASGDASISLVEGARLVFTSANWNRTALVAFQLDHRVVADTDARFVARSGNVPLAWSLTFLIAAGAFLLLAVYHRISLPRPVRDHPVVAAAAGGALLREFARTFALFFQKKGILLTLAFLLLYRFGEAQLVKLAAPFLLDGRETGGLGLTTGEVGFVYGTVGIMALTLGGILGGMAASRSGLRAWLLWMVVAVNLPDVVYIYLAHAQPESFFAVNVCVAVEQFGYGFGFTAYMLYMIYVSRGAHQTAHFAITTGFMALGMMLPGMFSGWLQEAIGYRAFFVWVLIATIPAFIVASMVDVDPVFGRKGRRTGT